MGNLKYITGKLSKHMVEIKFRILWWKYHNVRKREKKIKTLFDLANVINPKVKPIRYKIAFRLSLCLLNSLNNNHKNIEYMNIENVIPVKSKE